MALPLKDLIAQLQGQAGKWTPYDPSLQNVLGEAQRSLGDVDRMYSTGVNRTKLDYGREAEDMAEQNAENLQNDKYDWFGRGMGVSGHFDESQGKIGKAYTKGVGALERRRSDALEGLSDRRLSGHNSIRDMLMSAQAGAQQKAQAFHQQKAASEAEAAHKAAMLDLQRQQIEAQKEAARAQQNAFRGGMGLGGQTFPGGEPGTADLFASLAAMSPEELAQWKTWNVYLPQLKKQRAEARRRRKGIGTHMPGTQH